MTIATDTAAAFLKACNDAGFTASVNDRNIVTVTKTFDRGDNIAFREADGQGPNLLAMLPVGSPGSTWGTDGGSVGGAAGRDNGYYKLNKSGVQRRVTTALNNMLSARSDGRWLVQLSKGKAAYSTAHSSYNGDQARHYYRSFNVHSGYNKRLLDPTGKVVARTKTA